MHVEFTANFVLVDGGTASFTEDMSVDVRGPAFSGILCNLLRYFFRWFVYMTDLSGLSRSTILEPLWACSSLEIGAMSWKQKQQVELHQILTLTSAGFQMGVVTGKWNAALEVEVYTVFLEE